MNEAEYDAKIARLKREVDAFSKMPGVYIMRDLEGQVIYVGKAKNLRNRVRSYVRGGDGRQQIPFLMRRVETIETVVTVNDQEAYVLERDLIAKYKPKYNVRLKDDKQYLSIKVNENEEWPRLELVRRIEPDGARYFGPYSFSYELRELLEMINKVLPLRTCTNTVFYNRQRPCLEYQIKKCSAPCCLDVDRDEYREWVKEAISILDGKTSELEKTFTKKMEKASEELRFEDAAALRDKLEILKNFKFGGRYISSSGDERDAFALFREERLAVLTILKIRHGRVAENKNYTFAELEISDEELLESVLTQYYDGERELPPEIILPFELEDDSLIKEGVEERYKRNIEIIVPKRGLKARLLSLAMLNAKQHYATVFDAGSRYQSAAAGVARIVGLKEVPRRIECVDISNLQASDIVGGVVSFYDGEPDRKNYKKYIISRQDKPDDFGSIYEVVYRRLKHAMEDDSDYIPDLFLIDGGLGQLRAALQARDDLGCHCNIAALAKERNANYFKSGAKPERIFREGEEDSVLLPPDADSTLLVARIRDEAHRHVITFHRTRRAKRVFASLLDDVPGIGKERRLRLIEAFGSVKGMRNISEAELAEKGKLPKTVAALLYQKLHE